MVTVEERSKWNRWCLEGMLLRKPGKASHVKEERPQQDSLAG